MGIFTILPLMAIPIIIYNVMAWAGATFATAEELSLRLNEPFQTVQMASGAQWVITPGHALLAVALITLFFELLKSTGIGRAAIMNHAFSMILFIICLIEFLMFEAFATSVFFLITLMALMDVMAGFIVTIASARRDFAVGEGFGE
jgi:hypothetical protein